MKFNPMTQYLEIALGHREAVQCFIRHILNLPAVKTDQMMVERHIGVEACAFMADIHLAHEAGFSQHAERVIDGIAGDHRMTAFDDAIEIIGRRMTRRSRKRTINGCPLRRESHMVATEPFPDCIGCWAHTYLGMIPTYHTLYLRIKRRRSRGRGSAGKFVLHGREDLEGLIFRR
jgi:hypothetical protein